MINETDPVVHDFMRVTLPIETVVRCPTIAYDFRAWFDPSTNNVRQSFSGSIHNGNEKRSTSVAFHCTEYQPAVLGSTWLQRAVLDSTWLERAMLGSTWLERAVLGSRTLERAVLGSTWLQPAVLRKLINT
jgi:hypothetical protein